MPMTTETKNYEKELTKLYQNTYGEARQYMSSFDKVSVLKAPDGHKYAIGTLRNTDEQYTSGGIYEPHMRSWNVIFAGVLDKQGNLSGDSIRLKGEAEEACYRSEKYKQRKDPLSGEEMKQRQASTSIMIDFNKADELPRTVLCSDSSVQGRTTGDYSTMIDGFYNVVDKSAFLEASRSANRYQDSENDQKITELCAQFIISGEDDKKYQEAEQQRLKRNIEKKALQERLTKRQALRKFIERENERRSKGLKIFGYDVFQNSARKALAKRMLPKLIALVRAEHHA